MTAKHDAIGAAIDRWREAPPELLSHDLWNTPLRDLLADVDGWRWHLAALNATRDEWEHAETSRAYVEHRIAVLDAELNRRRRAYKGSGRPSVRKPESRRDEYDEIKRRLPLRTYLERYTPVRLQRAGSNLCCSCPFPDHDDTSPSFFVYPDQDSCWCYGCNRGGDIFDFALHFHELPSFVAAADVLRVAAGMTGGLVVKRPDGSYAPVR